MYFKEHKGSKKFNQTIIFTGISDHKCVVEWMYIIIFFIIKSHFKLNYEIYYFLVRQKHPFIKV